jgi:hypothetical protein
MNDTQLFLAIGMPTLAVLTGILVNHWQVSAINARFDDLKDTWRAELRRVEEVLDSRLRHLEERWRA